MINNSIIKKISIIFALFLCLPALAMETSVTQEPQNSNFLSKLINTFLKNHPVQTRVEGDVLPPNSIYRACFAVLGTGLAYTGISQLITRVLKSKKDKNTTSYTKEKKSWYRRIPEWLHERGVRMATGLIMTGTTLFVASDYLGKKVVPLITTS